MCGRFALYTVGEMLVKLFGLGRLPPLQPHYNIAPTEDIAVIRADPDEGASAPRVLESMRWGFVPAWAHDAQDLPLMINARSETVDEKPAYREAFQTSRCLIPADGFYEWQTTRHGKRPLFFQHNEKRPFAFAGLWSVGPDPKTGTRRATCTILTTEANERVAPAHDRMPVVLPRSAYATWLDPDLRDVTTLKSLLRPFPAQKMQAHAVSERVNKADYDAPDAVQPSGQTSLF